MSARMRVTMGAVVALVVGGWFGGRALVDRRAQRALIVPAGMGRETPADLGLTFSQFTILSGSRQLQARLVRAPETGATQTAVLVFHGNRTSIAQQARLQLGFYTHGITSMVFDYSGFGNSTGTPSVGKLRQDAAAAFGAFVDSVGRTARKYVMGTSLGAAVLLDAVDDIQLGVEGVVVVGTFASARRTAIREGRVPQLLAFVMPNRYDNVRAARRLRKPLLVVHSERDELFPMGDAEAIVAAAGGPSRLVRLSDVPHDDYLTTAAQWEPVITFMKPLP